MQFSTSFALATAATLLTTTVNAHMVMRTPKPFPGYNNSPLEADGSNFPCKNPSYGDRSGSTQMPIGSSQTLAFMGSAIHGGGSCQVSLTTDINPTKASRWMVIHSIEGGCPGQNKEQPMENLPADPNNIKGLNEYQFTIPAEIEAGEYVLAWSWSNKRGNREQYMVCAPVTVTGGSRKRSVEQRRQAISKRANLPDMFVANIKNVGHDDCATPEDHEVTYPNPGNSVERGTFSTNFAPPIGSGCGGGSSSGGSPPPVASPPATTSAPVAAPNPTGIIFHEPEPASSSSVVAVPIPSPAPAPPVENPEPPVENPEPQVSNPQPPTSSPPATGSPAGAQTGACTIEGEWNCIGGSSFQRCASGQWSTVMGLATGTACKEGISSEFTALKRSVRFSSEHLRRHVHGIS